MPVIKQYVNLPGATGGLGPTRALRVTPNQVPNVAPGDRVDWWIERDPGNMGLHYQSNTPAPPPGTLSRTVLAHGPQAGTTDAAGHHFDNSITFTQIGGDKYKVKASREGNRAQSVTTDEFETWRKLYYSVWYSNPESLARFNNIERRFQACYLQGYLELERKSIQATPAVVTEARVDYRSLGSPTNDWLFLNGGPNSIMSLRAYGAPPAAATLSDKPLHMALLLVPRGYFTRLERVVLPTLTAAVGSTPTYRTVFRDPQRGGNWLWTAQASWSGAGATDVTGYMSFTAGRPTDLRWDLQNLPGLTAFLATSPGNNYRLDFTFIWKSSIGGYSYGNFSVVLCTGFAEELTLQALCHEAGHAAGQAVQTEPQYDPGPSATVLATVDTNLMWYNDPYGGTGPHCHNNALLTADPSTPSGQIYTWGGGGNMCLMFYQLNANADPDVFCPYCLPRVKRRDLRAPTGSVGTWMDFG